METVPVLSLQVNDRSKKLQEAFAAKFGQNPVFYVRVPGRVNLIGEHIDYCGYGVCPMALEQDILLAVRPQETETLRLINLESTYSDFECNIVSFAITVENKAPEWNQYFLCGVKGVLDILPKDTQIKGFDVVVSGTIPKSAGLSSSSALVSAAALATAHVHNFSISKERIANLCAECERYIGTQGGGMDQAIAFLATKGCAKLIEFSPLRSKDVILPKEATFVIAHSLTQLNKAATADFNCRVVECRLAAQIIAKKQKTDWKRIKKLGELQQALKLDLNAMIDLVKAALHEVPYTKDEIVEELETNIENLNQNSLTQNTKHIESFKLKQRALHVFQEALRVQQFHETCSDKSADDGALVKLGMLMSESHESLRDLYECSHPQLDKLVELSRENSLGARLTGAGWGGCAVALVKPENLQVFVEALKKNFYGELNVRNCEELLFTTSPNGGACIYEP